MRILASLSAALSLAACGTDAPAPDTPNAAEPANDAAESFAPAPGANAGRWDLAASGEGTALMLRVGDTAAVTLFCPAGADRLLVNVPAFRAVGSEERMSFGSGGTVTALVADTSGDRQRGGVSATGGVPPDLAALIGGPVAVNYGAQNSGPHPAPPADLARGFVSACRDRPAAPAAPIPTPRSAAGVSPCLMQGEEQLANPPLRAIGTEPFWGARIEGRCVTYSHPDDPDGTRVWTLYSAGALGGGRWSGALGGRPFELEIRHAPGCSDGMSDRRYEFAATLDVQGERRGGCAERR
jgi:uncharacterized membrane protein